MAQFFANIAEELRSDTQVGSDLHIGNPVEQMGVQLDKFQVSLLCRSANGLQQPVLKEYEFIFNHHPKNPIEFQAFFVKLNQVRLGNLQNHRWFNGLDIELTGAPGMKAPDIGDPLVFDGKVKVVFSGGLVHLVHFETAFHNEMVMLTHISRGKDELTPLNRPPIDHLP